MANIIKKEKEHHRLAYFEFLECRSLREVSKRVGKSYNSICRWCDSFGWEERARLHDEAVMEKTSARLLEAKVKRNLKHLKDLDNIDQILDLLPQSLFDRDGQGKILNTEGKPLETHGGKAAIKVSLESTKDLNDFIAAKLRIQDQQRKIHGEVDQKVETKLELGGVPEELNEALKEYDAIIREIRNREENALQDDRSPE